MRATRETLDKLGIRVQVDSAARVVLTEVDSLGKLAALPAHALGDRVPEWFTGGLVENPEAARAAIAAGNPPPALVEAFDAERARLARVFSKPDRVAASVKRRRVYRDDGAELSFERLAVGDPEHWGSLTGGARRKRLVIGIQSGHTCNVCGQTNCDFQCPPEVFAKVAAMGAALAHVYTSQGYAVDVCSVYPHDGRAFPGELEGHRFFNLVALKKSDERLDARALLTVGLPAYARMLEHSVFDALAGRSDWWAQIPTLNPETVDALGIDFYLSGNSVTIPRPENHAGLVEALSGNGA